VQGRFGWLVLDLRIRHGLKKHLDASSATGDEIWELRLDLDVQSMRLVSEVGAEASAVDLDASTFHRHEALDNHILDLRSILENILYTAQCAVHRESELQQGR
jgi:hypothetical protein